MLCCSRGRSCCDALCSTPKPLLLAGASGSDSQLPLPSSPYTLGGALAKCLSWQRPGGGISCAPALPGPWHLCCHTAGALCLLSVNPNDAGVTCSPGSEAVALPHQLERWCEPNLCHCPRAPVGRGRVQPCYLLPTVPSCCCCGLEALCCGPGRGTVSCQLWLVLAWLCSAISGPGRER